MSNDLLLSVNDLCVNYGNIQAIKGINFRVKKGEIVSILGANGAGKTTTLRTISGLLKPKSGEIIYQGTDISKVPAHKIVQMGVSQSPEGRQVFGTLTVEENIRLGAFTRKKPSQETIDWIYELFPRLLERRKQLAGTLSGGEQQMLAISRALMAQPQLLLLDEPSLGIAPILVKMIFAAVKKISSSGVTVLLVEQNAKAALKLADRAYVLDVGKVTIEGDASELLSDPRVQEAYLGKKAAN
ncbi:ABC transporter ATP-binding protein [Limisalsivibrio acetivorans]|uniref:ABC transporter ATP-binding protein n=1 Tax=Limisalsivibrio acetivorans TaxID=1304888 RepID=UPI0003B54209|nr:ABC transporter ATP-binding protein [Limisalsivibrio acetivorans]